MACNLLSGGCSFGGSAATTAADLAVVTLWWSASQAMANEVLIADKLNKSAIIHLDSIGI